jgi:hypothetical protein
MKGLIVAVLLLNATASLIAQGLVNFFNDANNSVYAQALQLNGAVSIMSGPRDSFYFGLFLISSNTYTFTGLYATNTGVDGMFSGGTVAVPWWAAGTAMKYFVAGWSRDYMGHDFQQRWLGGGATGDFGYVFSDGTAVAGNGSTIPTLNLFNGGPGTIHAGNEFVLRNFFVPEPSAAALTALGAGMSLLYRKKRNNQPTKQET